MKRNRQETQNRFLAAVSRVIAQGGLQNLGINSVANEAGSDKVLIYRYFGDFEALLEQTSLDLHLPDLFAAETPEEAIDLIKEHFLSAPELIHIARGRHAFNNPLTKYYNEWFGEAVEALGSLLEHTGDIVPLVAYAKIEQTILSLDHTKLTVAPVQKSSAHKSASRAKRPTPAEDATQDSPFLEELSEELL